MPKVPKEGGAIEFRVACRYLYPQEPNTRQGQFKAGGKEKKDTYTDHSNDSPHSNTYARPWGYSLYHS